MIVHKKLNYFLLVLMGVTLICCKSKTTKEDNKTNSNEVVKTETSQVFSDNPKLQVYFSSLDQAVAEYLKFNQAIIETGMKTQKSGEKPDVGDIMNMMSGMASSAMKIDKYTKRMEELEKEAEIMKENMTDEELEAFAKTYGKIMSRFYEFGSNMQTKE